MDSVGVERPVVKRLRFAEFSLCQFRGLAFIRGVNFQRTLTDFASRPFSPSTFFMKRTTNRDMEPPSAPAAPKQIIQYHAAEIVLTGIKAYVVVRTEDRRSNGSPDLRRGGLLSEEMHLSPPS